jgi:HAD superfamily hydrolase (TIGR01509 family)
MTPPVSLVVFDIGGVLVRIARSWSEACAAAGVPARGPGDDEGAWARRRRPVEDYESGRIDHATFIAGIVESEEGRYTAAEVEQVHAAWILEEFPGVLALVDGLHAAGLETGILSNTNDAHWRRQLLGASATTRFPALQRVGHPHASHLLGVRKPAPEIYARMAARTGHAPARTLFFDDLPDNVAAARAAGWRAERVDPLGDPAAEMAAFLARHGVHVETPARRPGGA